MYAYSCGSLLVVDANTATYVTNNSCSGCGFVGGRNRMVCKSEEGRTTSQVRDGGPDSKSVLNLMWCWSSVSPH